MTRYYISAAGTGQIDLFGVIDPEHNAQSVCSHKVKPFVSRFIDCVCVEKKGGRLREEGLWLRHELQHPMPKKFYRTQSTRKVDGPSAEIHYWIILVSVTGISSDLTPFRFAEFSSRHSMMMYAPPNQRTHKTLIPLVELSNIHKPLTLFPSFRSALVAIRRDYQNVSPITR